MICKEEKVKWWRIESETSHSFIKEDFCIEETPDVYGELNGIKIFLSSSIFKETTWNWDLLSLEEKKKIKKSYEENDISTVLEIHNKHLLSGIRLCCENVYLDMQLKLAIKNNWI